MNVSLGSILSSYGYGTSTSTSTSTTKTDATTAISVAQAKLAKALEAQSTQTTSGTQVSISPAALAAAAAKEDNEKDYAVLFKEVRAGLDAQYAAGTPKSAPDLDKLSGRALAIVALNKEGQFSAAESRAAKEALRDDVRESFTSMVGRGGDLSSIANFSKTLAAQYDAMSPEEREARGWSEQFRDTNSDFATNFTMPSLFDQI